MIKHLNNIINCLKTNPIIFDKHLDDGRLNSAENESEVLNLLLQHFDNIKIPKIKQSGCNRSQFANWLPDNNFPFFTFNFQLARGQSHCRDCPLAFGDILILKLLIFLKCDFNLTVAR